MAAWQSVGFMHGVMNTDNFSILGLTLDYGPYGFMEAYEPGHICNHTDHGGRYAFDRQPAVGLWNCLRAGERARITGRSGRTSKPRSRPTCRRFARRTRRRCAPSSASRRRDDGDDELIAGVARRDGGRAAPTSRARSGCSPTCARRPKPRGRRTGSHGSHREALFLALGGDGRAAAWIDATKRASAGETRPTAERAAAMRAVNPRIVLRNHLAQETIVAARSRRRRTRAPPACRVAPAVRRRSGGGGVRPARAAGRAGRSW